MLGGIFWVNAGVSRLVAINPGRLSFSSLLYFHGSILDKYNNIRRVFRRSLYITYRKVWFPHLTIYWMRNLNVCKDELTVELDCLYWIIFAACILYDVQNKKIPVLHVSWSVFAWIFWNWSGLQFLLKRVLPRNILVNIGETCQSTRFQPCAASLVTCTVVQWEQK